MGLGGLGWVSGSSPDNIRSSPCRMQTVPTSRWGRLPAWEDNDAGTQPEEPTGQVALQDRSPTMPVALASSDGAFRWPRSTAGPVS